MKNDQFMEDINEHDFKQVTSQEPSHFQETFIHIEHVSNPLLIGIKLVQPVQFKLVKLVQSKPIYIFPNTLAIYVQHESLKQVTFFFEQVTLVAQTWPQTIDDLVDLRLDIILLRAC